MLTTHNLTKIAALNDAARKSFLGFRADVAITHKPVLITSQTSNAILLCQDDWDATMEMLYLLSKPNMQNSIISGMRENHRGLPTDLDW